jgi:transcriptional regulator with XRE-family HTH domain
MNESSVLQKIRKVREIKNLRQDYLAQELELSLRAYTKVETGETELTFKRFFKIASILQIKPEELLGFDYKSIFNNCDKSGNHNTYTFDQNLVNELLKSKDAQIKLLELRIFELNSK